MKETPREEWDRLFAELMAYVYRLEYLEAMTSPEDEVFI
jgi:hypothetical protein